MNIAGDLKRLRKLREAEKKPDQCFAKLTEEESRLHVAIDSLVPKSTFKQRSGQRSQNGCLADNHRALPQNLDAEKGVLSSIMNAAIKGAEIGRNAMFYAEQQIGANHFHLPAHKEIWRAIQALHKDNEPLNFIAITEELDSARALDRCGGAEYVTEIGTFLPTHVNLDYYVQILQEKHALRQIAELGARLTASAYDLGQSDPSFILDEAATTLKAIKTAKRIGELPELDDMSLLMGQNKPPRPPELVQGILHRGSKLIIGGTSKGRKTFGLMDLAISVSTGTDWWGCPTIKSKVCYINFEIQTPFFADRNDDICRVKNVVPERGMFRAWNLRGYSEGLEKMTASIIKVLLQEDYGLIIFDPIYKALGDRDENKAGDVASMLNELEAIAVKTGAAIAFGAHYSKGNQASKDAMDRIGGSGVFARDPDAILTMTPHATDDCFTVDATLRNFPPLKPFVLKWEWPLFERDETEDPEDLKKPKRINSKQDGKFEEKFTENDFLSLLAKTNTGRTPGEFKRLAMEQLLCSESTFKRYWRRIKDSPYIEEKNGRFFASVIFSQTQKP